MYWITLTGDLNWPFMFYSCTAPCCKMVGLYAGRTVVPKYELVQKCKGFVREQSYCVVRAGSGLSWGFWKQEWVGVRTSVQATSVSPPRGAPVHTDTQDVAQCLGEKLVWTTKPCAFCFLCWGDYFPTSSGANLISVGADTCLMCIIMQGSTCHLQWKQTSRQFLSPWQRSEYLSFSLTQPPKKTGKRKSPKVSTVLAIYI